MCVHCIAGRWLWKYLKGPVQEIESGGSSFSEIKDTRISRHERENSSLEEMRERIFKLERKNS